MYSEHIVYKKILQTWDSEHIETGVPWILDGNSGHPSDPEANIDIHNYYYVSLRYVTNSPAVQISITLTTVQEVLLIQLHLLLSLENLNLNQSVLEIPVSNKPTTYFW